MRAVNLLPREDTRRRRTKRNPVALAAVLGVVLIVAVLAAALLNEHSKVSSKRAVLAGLQAELAAIPPPAEQSVSDRSLEAEKRNRVSTLSEALSYRVSWDRVLRELSLVLPDDVWLSGLNARAPVSPVAGAPGTVSPQPSASPSGFTLKGYTYSQSGVARLLSRLTVVPDLKNVQLQSSAVTKVSGRDVVQFSILADLRSPGGTS